MIQTQNLILVAALLLVSVISDTYAENSPEENLAALVRQQVKRTDLLQKAPPEWAKQLSSDSYHVMREKGTERAYSTSMHLQKDVGEYVCAACELPLFASETKFDSGTGWPSFFRPIAKDVLHYEDDDALFMSRIEVLCARCGGHLGHVFTDGPKPTGLRYCINSVALRFIKK